MTVNAAGRIQMTLSPMLPATCAVCNRSANNEVRFIDFAKNLDYYGAIVICESCIVEAAELFDCAPVALANHLAEEVESLREILQEVQENNVRLNTTLDSLLLLRPNLFSDDSTATEPDSEDSSLFE